MRRFLTLAALAATATASAIAGVPAASAAGTCPNAKYRTGPSLYLPDCRAYEMVTPQGKTNEVKSLTANGSVNPAKVAADGNAMLYMTISGPLANDASAGMPAWERAARTSTGWTVRPAVGPVVGPYADTTTGTQKWAVTGSSLDRLFVTASAVFSPDQVFSGNTAANGGVFLTDGTHTSWVSHPTWAGALPAQGTVDAKWSWFAPVGGSDDLDTVYFNSAATLTPEDATSGRSALQSMATYRWHDGTLSNAGVLPDGSISPGGSVAADRVDLRSISFAAPSGVDTELSRNNAVSADGKSFLFVSPDPARAKADASLPKPQLYMAIEGQGTVLLSAPDGADAPLAGTAGVAATGSASGATDLGYAVATRDHSVVLFSTVDALTADADANATTTVKTYRYDAADTSLTYLPDLDRPTSQEDGSVIALSATGNAMLYRTPDGLLRLWREGATTETISADVASTSISGAAITHARFSADGQVLVLNSQGPLRGEPNHIPGKSTQPFIYRPQVYRYVADTDALTCISCPPGGSDDGAVISMWGPATGLSSPYNLATAYWTPRGMTTDGSTVYFTTATALTDEDHNTVTDVYQWRDGKVQLISTGASGSLGEYLYDTSADGRDVFISSQERLVPADKDDFYDIYDARVDGGFDPPQAAGSGVSCEGDECQGPPPSSPLLAPVGSLSFVGRAVPPATPGGSAKRARLKVAKARTVRGTSARIAVSVSGRGRIQVSGPRVRRSARTAKKAGRYRIVVRLTKRARRALAHRHRITVRVTVRFTPAQGAARRARVRVRFRQAHAHARHRSSNATQARSSDRSRKER